MNKLVNDIQVALDQYYTEWNKNRRIVLGLEESDLSVIEKMNMANEKLTLLVKYRPLFEIMKKHSCTAYDSHANEGLIIDAILILNQQRISDRYK